MSGSEADASEFGGSGGSGRRTDSVDTVLTTALVLLAAVALGGLLLLAITMYVGSSGGDGGKEKNKHKEKNGAQDAASRHVYVHHIHHGSGGGNAASSPATDAPGAATASAAAFASNKPVSGAGFVVFSRAKCPHCKHMASELPELQRLLSESDIPCYVTDADAGDDAADRFDVHAFPTMRWYADLTQPAKYAEYNGARKAGDMAAFARQRAGK